MGPTDERTRFGAVVKRATHPSIEAVMDFGNHVRLFHEGIQADNTIQDRALVMDRGFWNGNLAHLLLLIVLTCL